MTRHILSLRRVRDRTFPQGQLPCLPHGAPHGSRQPARSHPRCPPADDSTIGNQPLFEQLPHLFSSLDEETYKQEQDTLIAESVRDGLTTTL